jgi:zinc protease
MRRISLKLLAAGCLMLSFLGVPGAHSAVAQTLPWPHQASDIPPDPAVRYGALPNGMRYVLMRNATPPGQIAMRLRIAAGSLQESDAQQGIAHFLEHLAFRGSTNVAAGELQRMLERIGLRMGADTNATTGQTQTVYRFDLTNNQDQTIDTGLMLMREIASELLITPEAVDMERGVVLSEERFRDSPAARAREAQAAFLLKGQFALQRLPIGKPEVIRAAPASELVDYYRTYYRPERTVLVMTGDFDVAAMEQKIAQRFSDWQAKATDRPDPDLGAPLQRELETALFVEAAGPRFVSVSWAKPYDASPDTAANRRRNLVEAIGLAVINQRLQRAASRVDPPFLGAGVSRNNMWRSANMATLSVSYEGEAWREALLEAERIRLDVVANGVAQHEVDRELTSLRSRHDAAIARVSTRPTPGLANGILGALEREEVFSDPPTDYAVMAEDLRRLRASDVSAALRETFAGQGPLLFLASEAPVENGEAALAEVFEQAKHAPALVAAAPNRGDWPYTNFGRPGAVVEQRDVPDLGVRFARFANGVLLTIKPTRLRADEVLVSVQLDGGRKLLPKDQISVVWAANVLISGGLEELDQLDIRRALTARIYGASFGIGEDAFTL